MHQCVPKHWLTQSRLKSNVNIAIMLHSIHDAFLVIVTARFYLHCYSLFTLLGLTASGRRDYFHIIRTCIVGAIKQRHVSSAERFWPSGHPWSQRDHANPPPPGGTCWHTFGNSCAFLMKSIDQLSQGNRRRSREYVRLVIRVHVHRQTPPIALPVPANVLYIVQGLLSRRAFGNKGWMAHTPNTNISTSKMQVWPTNWSTFPSHFKIKHQNLYMIECFLPCLFKGVHQKGVTNGAGPLQYIFIDFWTEPRYIIQAIYIVDIATLNIKAMWKTRCIALTELQMKPSSWWMQV